MYLQVNSERVVVRHDDLGGQRAQTAAANSTHTPRSPNSSATFSSSCQFSKLRTGCGVYSPVRRVRIIQCGPLIRRALRLALRQIVETHQQQGHRREDGDQHAPQLIDPRSTTPSPALRVSELSRRSGGERLSVAGAAASGVTVRCRGSVASARGRRRVRADAAW